MRRKVSMRFTRSKQHRQLDEDPRRAPEISLPVLHHSSIRFQESDETNDELLGTENLQVAGTGWDNFPSPLPSLELSRHDVQNEFEKLLDIFDKDYCELVEHGSTTLHQKLGRAPPSRPLQVFTEDEKAWSPSTLLLDSNLQHQFIPATPIRESSRRFSIPGIESSTSTSGSIETFHSTWKFRQLEGSSSPIKEVQSPTARTSDPYSIDFPLRDETPVSSSSKVGNQLTPQPNFPPKDLVTTLGSKFASLGGSGSSNTSSSSGSIAGSTVTFGSFTARSKSSGGSGTLRTALVPTEVVQLMNSINTLPRLSSRRMALDNAE